MNKELIDVIERSIKHWTEDHVKLKLFGGDETTLCKVFGSYTCACCDMFGDGDEDDGCDGACPVIDSDGRTCFSNNSDWERARSAALIVSELNKAKFMEARTSIIYRLKKALAKEIG